MAGLRMCGDIPLLNLYAFMACTVKIVTFTFTFSSHDYIARDNFTFTFGAPYFLQQTILYFTSTKQACNKTSLMQAKHSG